MAHGARGAWRVNVRGRMARVAARPESTRALAPALAALATKCVIQCVIRKSCIHNSVTTDYGNSKQQEYCVDDRSLGARGVLTGVAIMVIIRGIISDYRLREQQTARVSLRLAVAVRRSCLRMAELATESIHRTFFIHASINNFGFQQLQTDDKWNVPFASCRHVVSQCFATQ